MKTVNTMNRDAMTEQLLISRQEEQKKAELALARSVYREYLKDMGLDPNKEVAFPNKLENVTEFMQACHYLMRNKKQAGF